MDLRIMEPPRVYPIAKVTLDKDELWTLVLALSFAVDNNNANRWSKEARTKLVALHEQVESAHGLVVNSQ